MYADMYFLFIISCFSYIPLQFAVIVGAFFFTSPPVSSVSASFVVLSDCSVLIPTTLVRARSIVGFALQVDEESMLPLPSFVAYTSCHFSVFLARSFVKRFFCGSAHFRQNFGIIWWNLRFLRLFLVLQFLAQKAVATAYWDFSTFLYIL